MKKVNFRNLPSQLSLLLLAVLLTFSVSVSAQEDSASEAEQTTAAVPAADGVGDAVAGKALFNANCAACHKLDKKATGPALRGVTLRYDRNWLYEWIKDSQGMIKSGDSKAVALFAENNNSVMTSFPALSNGDIDNILAYASEPKAVPVAGGDTAATGTTTGGGDGVSNNIILAALALVFGLLVVMLFLVTGTLKKIAQANGVEYQERETKTPLWKAFAQNQFLVLVTSIFLLLCSAYFAYGWMMQVGVDQGYAPVQPIHFSHKIHAGDNKVDCNYCHSSARKSKTSGIPSLNVCMNCHKNISEYAGEADLESGYTQEFYTKEIKKLYDAVGWDETTQAYTGNTKPVKWTRIHNLPDFAYFNHSQHVTVAGVDCQKCHGPVEEMEIVEQFAPLTMGWCINCHRETNVKVEDNEYYSKIHEELSKKYGVEKLTIAQLGGLECGKCHY
ncbi:c-type cytochrome [Ulvibacter antarcticus]|uniref:Quinol:cytochrome c oxidoreductase pentaheme cytochrome subunit n=1 Tax=Ulvibacter antarcticus TaxID=442714 RepID=A0A3L9YYQ8_9FLAO|nr:c-type cytochrome [Ulvibacter antarcticus]RMA65703.1 quinol:cytochrome c oxidoreductase pentaheme cytochrome subunit [Ulvibacter antarcticus]